LCKNARIFLSNSSSVQFCKQIPAHTPKRQPLLNLQLFGTLQRMKVTRNIPEQLIIENRPWVISLALIATGLIFIGIGLSIFLSGELMGLFFMVMGLVPFGLLFAFARRTQALFLGPEGKLIIRRRTLLGGSTIEHRLDEVGKAIVQSSTGDNGATYRVALIFPEGQSAGTHPLTLAYDNYGDHHGMADTINAWLDSKDPTA